MKTLTFIFIEIMILYQSAWAVNKSFSKALKHVELKSSSTRGEPDEWFIPVMFGLVVIVLIMYFYRLIEERRKQPQAAKISPKKRRQNFIKQARLSGFTGVEARLLFQLTELIAESEPERLLQGGPGWRQLVKEVTARIDRRRRELEVMGDLLEKLGRMAAHDIQQRDDVRIQAEVAIWMVPKDSLEPEVGFENSAEQVAGTLLDLSAAGAAMRADFAGSEGDLIEFWSADPNIWLPPTTARILHLKEEGEMKVFNLHFVKEPSDDLREAIVTLQRTGRRAAVS